MESIELDITDAASIDSVAAKLIASHPDLNVIINNGGIMLPDLMNGREVEVAMPLEQFIEEANGATRDRC